MAIQNNIAAESNNFGVAFNNAYYRIERAEIERQIDPEPRFKVRIHLAGYATSEATSATQAVHFLDFDVPLDTIESTEGDGFLSKCYTWVMAQSNMNGSTAV